MLIMRWQSSISWAETGELFVVAFVARPFCLSCTQSYVFLTSALQSLTFLANWIFDFVDSLIFIHVTNDLFVIFLFLGGLCVNKKVNIPKTATDLLIAKRKDEILHSAFNSKVPLKELHIITLDNHLYSCKHINF